jgi:uncharacterized protein (DUF1810 family)
MPAEYDLSRFISAQQEGYPIALAEIRAGKKRSHWIWYIFPQIEGLGFSTTSKFYAIKEMDEAQAYAQHPVLGHRLHEISRELLKISSGNANSVFGSPDDLKLRSSMTLFAALPGADPVFQAVLDKFFHGQKDPRTVEILAH